MSQRWRSCCDDPMNGRKMVGHDQASAVAEGGGPVSGIKWFGLHLQDPMVQTNILG